MGGGGFVSMGKGRWTNSVGLDRCVPQCSAPKVETVSRYQMFHCLFKLGKKKGPNSKNEWKLPRPSIEGICFFVAERSGNPGHKCLYLWTCSLFPGHWKEFFFCRGKGTIRTFAYVRYLFHIPKDARQIFYPTPTPPPPFSIQSNPSDITNLQYHNRLYKSPLRNGPWTDMAKTNTEVSRKMFRSLHAKNLLVLSSIADVAEKMCA